MFVAKPMMLRIRKIVNIKYSKNPERVIRDKIKKQIYPDIMNDNQEAINKVMQSYNGFMAVVELYDEVHKMKEKLGMAIEERNE